MKTKITSLINSARLVVANHHEMEASSVNQEVWEIKNEFEAWDLIVENADVSEEVYQLRDTMIDLLVELEDVQECHDNERDTWF